MWRLPFAETEIGGVRLASDRRRDLLERRGGNADGNPLLRRAWSVRLRSGIIRCTEGGGLHVVPFRCAGLLRRFVVPLPCIRICRARSLLGFAASPCRTYTYIVIPSAVKRSVGIDRRDNDPWERITMILMSRPVALLRMTNTFFAPTRRRARCNAPVGRVTKEARLRYAGEASDWCRRREFCGMGMPLQVAEPEEASPWCRRREFRAVGVRLLGMETERPFNSFGRRSAASRGIGADAVSPLGMPAALCFPIREQRIYPSEGTIFF